MFKKKNNMLLATILLALGGMNTAYAGAGLDCTSAATIKASNDDGTGAGTVTAEQVLACAEKAQADPEKLAALATLTAADDDLSSLAAASLKSTGKSAAAATAIFLDILTADGVPKSVKNDGARLSWFFATKCFKKATLSVF
jgi:alkaline phosphatase